MLPSTLGYHSHHTHWSRTRTALFALRSDLDIKKTEATSRSDSTFGIDQFFKLAGTDNTADNDTTGKKDMETITFPIKLWTPHGSVVAVCLLYKTLDSRTGVFLHNPDAICSVTPQPPFERDSQASDSQRCVVSIRLPESERSRAGNVRISVHRMSELGQSEEHSTIVECLYTDLKGNRVQGGPH